MTKSAPHIVPGRISVIIPCYNYARYLGDAIDSVLRQQGMDLEIIVVDDGSTDDTAGVSRRYGDTATYIYQENQGLSAARNTGLANCTGEFVLFLDADDLLGKKTLQSQLNYLRSHPDASIVVCNNWFFHQIDSDGKPETDGSWRMFRRHLDVHLCFFNVAPPHAYFCRRSAVLQIGEFVSGIDTCADYDFWLRAAALGYVPQGNPRCRVYYRRHADSMSWNQARQSVVDAEMHHRLVRLLGDHPNFPNGYRLEGFMACAAGILVTAERLLNFGVPGTQDLIDLAKVILREALPAAEKHGRPNSRILFKLNYTRILYSLTRTKLRDLSRKDELLNLINQILFFVGSPLNSGKGQIELMLSSIFGSRAYAHERKRMRELLKSMHAKRLQWS